MTVPNLGLWPRLCAALVWGGLTSTPAYGQPIAGNELSRSTMLNWVRLPGAESCSGPDEIAAKIEARIGHSVFVSHSVAELAIEAHVEPNADKPGWKVGIVMSRRGGAIIGERSLSSDDPSCLEIIETSALAVAVMIDPDAVERTSAATATTNVPQRLEQTPSPVSSPQNEGDSSPVSLSELEASFVIATGLLPNAALGIAVDGLTTFPKSVWGLLLGGTYFYKRNVQLASGAGAEFGAYYGTLAGCLRPFTNTNVEWALCAGAQVGALAANGIGLAASKTVTRWLVNPVAEGHLSLRLNTKLRLDLTGVVETPLFRDYFEIGSESTRKLLYRATAVGGAIQMGLGWAF